MVHSKVARLLAVLLAVFGLVTTSGLSLAQQENGGSGLSISPTRTELNLEPGKQDTVQISIRNVTSGPIIAKPFINDFESDNAYGEPRLYKNPDQRNSASVFNFITGLEDVTLSPGEDKDLTYPIKIPSDAAPGAYYGAITFRAVPENSSGAQAGEVALTANVSSLVLLEVPGNITEKIQILDIKARKGETVGSFFTSAPDKAAVTIKNLGNSFSKPFGTAQVKNAFGKEVYTFEINNLIPKGNILPNSQRIFVEELKNVKTPGRYTIDANISHGRGGEILNFKTSFWYLPIWFILTILALVLIIAGVGFVLYMKMAKKRIRSRTNHR